MDFEDAASFFDDDPVYDAYTGTLLFYCHTTPHDDHTSSGATARRRTMTTIPTTAMPARGVVRIYEDNWLVSDSNPDGYKGTNVRRSYSLKKSTGLVALLTVGEACLGAAGTEFYAHKEYFRDLANARTESDWDVMWNVFCPTAEALSKGKFLRQGGVLLRVRSVYPSIDEYQVAESDQLDDDAYQPVTFTTVGAPDLVTEKRPTVSVATTAIQTDLQKFYEFRTESESIHKPGDRTVFVAKAAITPTVGTTFTMQGATWRCMLVVPENDAWAILARLA